MLPFRRSVRSRGAELIDLPRRGRGNLLSFSRGPRLVAPRGGLATTRDSRKIEERGDDGPCERAYSTALARKENARRKERQGGRGEKGRGKERKKKEEKVKTDENRGKQKRTKARARDGGGLKNDIHRETK